MSGRLYSVHALNALRAAVENKFLFGSYDRERVCGWSRQYSDVEKITAVEQMVRTHMEAGHTAEDLIASEREESGHENATQDG